MRELSLRLFALMQNTITLQESVALWRLWCVAFLNESLTDMVQDAVDAINEAVRSASLDPISEVDESLMCDGSKYQ